MESAEMKIRRFTIFNVRFCFAGKYSPVDNGSIVKRVSEFISIIKILLSIIDHNFWVEKH
jgi:hypothetical protein